MKVIYIAGKYRGPNAWAVEQNIRAAEEVAAKVWAMGHAALCPHANSRHMEGVASDEVFLAGTLEMLRRCDAVVVIPGWHLSEGAKAEVAEARRLKIPVFGAEESKEDDCMVVGSDGYRSCVHWTLIYLARFLGVCENGNPNAIPEHVRKMVYG